MPVDMKVRFMCNANGGADDIYLDEIRVSGRNATPPSSPYEAWWQEQGLSGLDTNCLTDSDSDGLNQLLEYGLGGNPSSNDVAAVLPMFGNKQGGGSASLEYVYRRRTDAAGRGLAYWLELSTNLISGVWTTNGYIEVGTGSLESGFEAVTNHISTETNANRYIRLRISID